MHAVPVAVAVEEWRPSIQEIAVLTPAYTRGGFDDDSDGAQEAGAEHGVYDDTTSPTEDEVQALIDAACDEIAGRVGAPITATHAGLARIAACWHVAAAIAGAKMPAGTDDASGEYRGHAANYRFSLDRLIALCNRLGARLA